MCIIKYITYTEYVYTYRICVVGAKRVNLSPPPPPEYRLYAPVNRVSIDPDNGLLPIRRQTII